MGAVNIKNGQMEALIMPTSNTETFQSYLDYFNNQLNGKPAVIILDNPSWHKRGKLSRGNPVYLPPYSPTLNPVERLWKVLKDMMPVFNEISNEDELQEIIINNLQTFFHNPDLVKSICGISE